MLALLVQQTRATDSQLREAVGVSTNQQLAGVLSGVSKQAAAFDLPARAVFTIENESKSGETTKTYVVSNIFLQRPTHATGPWMKRALLSRAIATNARHENHAPPHRVTFALVPERTYSLEKADPADGGQYSQVRLH